MKGVRLIQKWCGTWILEKPEKPVLLQKQVKPEESKMHYLQIIVDSGHKQDPGSRWRPLLVAKTQPVNSMVETANELPVEQPPGSVDLQLRGWMVGPCWTDAGIWSGGLHGELNVLKGWTQAPISVADSGLRLDSTFWHQHFIENILCKERKRERRVPCVAVLSFLYIYNSGAHSYIQFFTEQVQTVGGMNRFQ